MTETCADDFATIRARMEELRREVERERRAKPKHGQTRRCDPTEVPTG